MQSQKDKQAIHKIIVNMQIGSKKTNTPLPFSRISHKSNDSCDIEWHNLFCFLRLFRVTG